MTKCSADAIEFPGCRGRKVQAVFGGQTITSDGGGLLVRAADQSLGLLRRAARACTDSRRAASCAHSLESLLRQRVYALALGYEDLNDHDVLRNDPALQTAVGRDVELASAATLCRFENRVDKASLWALSALLVDVFLESHATPPAEIILDFDATDDRVHGMQEGRFFHGYYDHYCFLPLYVFCGEHLLAAYLRPSNIDPAKHALGILSLLVKRIRHAWPNTRIIYRGDSGFCRWKTMRWCDSRGVGYILGLAKNSRLAEAAAPLVTEAKERFVKTREKQKIFGEIRYAAATWDCERRVIVKAEHLEKGANPRYVVTNLDGEPSEIYGKYCARGEMENRIKEQQLCLFADRTSCSKWLPNQLRVLLSGLAYTLLQAIRRLALPGTELAQARCDTIRLKLLKIGAAVLRNSRRVQVLLSENYPFKELFALAAARLRAG
ncbi:IS1380 family transposase [Megalodesulfovibrio gigas]|uniref:Putative IS4 family transposase n=2 Tax=Megalodesulfovibrio gigas TaxID=879 RepID=T2GDW7_MEGG1|nr:IS1380 family transposase [Megalodesulfovibrio gigas]AGW14374.1 putative IS4 family transposase [Megalodesulfovibrio gigas DSM 1382 = ATCC 19364]